MHELFYKKISSFLEPLNFTLPLTCESLYDIYFLYIIKRQNLSVGVHKKELNWEELEENRTPNFEP